MPHKADTVKIDFQGNTARESPIVVFDKKTAVVGVESVKVSFFPKFLDKSVLWVYNSNIKDFTNDVYPLNKGKKRACHFFDDVGG